MAAALAGDATASSDMHTQIYTYQHTHTPTHTHSSDKKMQEATTVVVVVVRVFIGSNFLLLAPSDAQHPPTAQLVA